jgi:hypothetical protein
MANNSRVSILNPASVGSANIWNRSKGFVPYLSPRCRICSAKTPSKPPNQKANDAETQSWGDWAAPVPALTLRSRALFARSSGAGTANT